MKQPVVAAKDIVRIAERLLTAAQAVLAVHGFNMPTETRDAVVTVLATGFGMVVWWVYVDRQRRVLELPFEFDAFVFFAWVFVFPYYLYRTRRARGLLLAAAIYALSVTPSVIVIAIRVSHSK